MSVRKTKAQYFKAIEGTGGVTSEIATKLNLSLRSVQKRIAEDKEIAEAVAVEKLQLIGDAESVLVEAIRVKRNAKVAMWYLERQARDHGYGRSVHVEGSFNPVGTVKLVLPDNGRDSGFAKQNA